MGRRQQIQTPVRIAISKDAEAKEIMRMPKTKMTKPQKATLSRVKKEMDLPRVAMSARRTQVLKPFARSQAEID